MQEYPKVHNLVKHLFLVKISPGLPLAERVKHFAKNWKKLIKLLPQNTLIKVLYQRDEELLQRKKN